jgi:hypothetical protein
LAALLAVLAGAVGLMKAITQQQKARFEAQWPKKGLYQPYVPPSWPCPHEPPCATITICGQMSWRCVHEPRCPHRTACAVVRMRGEA